MSNEKPKVFMKLEVSLPDREGGPAKKFSVNRALKARWSDDNSEVTKEILDEIKNYRGSFMGDIVAALSTAARLHEGFETPEHVRRLDVAKWTAALIENMLFASIKEKLHEDFVNNGEIPNWDGTTKTIDRVEKSELTEVDMDRLMLLLMPRIKHAVYLISKDIKQC